MISKQREYVAIAVQSVFSAVSDVLFALHAYPEEWRQWELAGVMNDCKRIYNAVEKLYSDREEG